MIPLSMAGTIIQFLAKRVFCFPNLSKWYIKVTRVRGYVGLAQAFRMGSDELVQERQVLTPSIIEKSAVNVHNPSNL